MLFILSNLKANSWMEIYLMSHSYIPHTQFLILFYFLSHFVCCVGRCGEARGGEADRSWWDSQWRAHSVYNATRGTSRTWRLRMPCALQVNADTQSRYSIHNCSKLLYVMLFTCVCALMQLWDISYFASWVIWPASGSAPYNSERKCPKQPRPSSY